jgi:hypothetical protein
VIVSGMPWSPSDAARWVAKEISQHSWIPSPVALGAAMPLSEGEIVELYSTNRSISVDVERELSQPLPDASDLPSPGEFETLTNTKTCLSGVDRGFRADLWQTAASRPTPRRQSRPPRHQHDHPSRVPSRRPSPGSGWQLLWGSACGLCSYRTS